MGFSWERIGYIFHLGPKVYSGPRYPRPGTEYSGHQSHSAQAKSITSKLYGRQSYDAGHLEHEEPQYSPPLVAQPRELRTSNGAQRIRCIPLFLARSLPKT